MTFGHLWASGKRFVFLTPLFFLVAGAAASLAGHLQTGTLLWLAGTAVILAVLAIDILANVFHGSFALDIIAAIAMVAAIWLGEGLAGIIVAVMYSGGQALENYAQGRVRREMDALLSAAPRNAARFRDGNLESVPVDAVAGGDRLLVRHGELVPVDGRLLSASATLDQSMLTGEALPVRFQAGDTMLSGAANAGDAFELEATNTSAESTYAGIVKLVETAQNSKSPIMRIADRYAVAFLLITLVASGAAWLLSGDPHRALAVLVVATPCPLILAVPIAILAGVSRCAAKGILIKGGEALERLAGVETVLLDKTGTITDGNARLAEIRTFGDFDAGTLLQLAASLDQGSHHVLAEAIIAAARERGLAPQMPESLKEEAGSGIEGVIGGRRVALGGSDYISSMGGDPARVRQVEAWAQTRDRSAVTVMVDGSVAGALFLEDRIRPETPTVLRRLRDSGARRIVLLTGDRADLAASVAATLGLDDFRSEMKPADKIAAVEAEKARGHVLMIGDGVNDAPALAAADVGVAMGARGAAASSEAADVVLLVDRLDRLVTALRVARRSRSIAIQSAVVGVGLSALAMLAAMIGLLPPVTGALLQEAIDIAVILNALRALGEPLRQRRAARRIGADELQGLENEHQRLRDIIDEISRVADSIPHLSGTTLRKRVQDLHSSLVERLLPHERHDDRQLFPRLTGGTGGMPIFTSLSRSHMEIQRRAHIFGRLVQALPDDPGETDRRDMQRLLDGLEAITRLHFEEEEEIYRMLESP